MYSLVGGEIKDSHVSNPADAEAKVATLQAKSRFDSDPQYKAQIQAIFDKVQSFRESTGSKNYWSKAEKAQAEAYLNTVSDEDYKAYQAFICFSVGFVKSKLPAKHTPIDLEFIPIT